MRHRKVVLVAALPLLALAGQAFGQSAFNSVASFTGNTGSAPGANPYAGLTLSGSTLYGTTTGGGANGDGEVYSIPTAGGPPTVLTAFTGITGSAPGATPFAGLTLSGTTLYGTTGYGGANDVGEIYSIPTSGGTPTVVATFTGGSGSIPGALPVGGVTILNGFLNGTTAQGGANSDGTLYAIPVSGGAPPSVLPFTGNAGNAGGAEPLAGLTLSGDTFYGTTYVGGLNGEGEVYSIRTVGLPIVLASFTGNTGSTPGLNPEAAPTISGGTLYGTTFGGGVNGDGEIFSLSIYGGPTTVLASFTGGTGSAPGANPVSGLTLVGDTLYGTTEFGGANGDGEVFSIPTSGGTPTVLASFTGTAGSTPGANPDGDLTVVGNTLYGTTYAGGADNDGTIFSLTVPTVPEPGSASLLALAGVGLLRRRRRSRPGTVGRCD